MLFYLLKVSGVSIGEAKWLQKGIGEVEASVHTGVGLHADQSAGIVKGGTIIGRV